MTMEAEDILYAARALRPHLDKILGKVRALSLGNDIDDFLQRAEKDEKVDNLLLDRMTQEEELREWLKETFAGERHRGLAKASRLPGNTDPVETKHYVCSQQECDFTWSLRRVGQPIPKACPIDGAELVLPDVDEEE
jgi:hypothetical protein